MAAAAYNIAAFAYFPRLMMLVMSAIGCRARDYLAALAAGLSVSGIALSGLAQIRSLKAQADVFSGSQTDQAPL